MMSRALVSGMMLWLEQQFLVQGSPVRIYRQHRGRSHEFEGCLFLWQQVSEMSESLESRIFVLAPLRVAGTDASLRQGQPIVFAAHETQVNSP